MSALRTAALVLLGLGYAGTASAKPKIAIGKLEGALKASVARSLEQATSGKAKLASHDDWTAAASRAGASPLDATAIREIARSIGASSVLYVTSGRDGRKWQVTVEVIDVSSQTIVKRWKVRSKKITRVSYLIKKLFWKKVGPTITRIAAASPAVAEAPKVEAPPPPVESPPPPPPPVVVAPPPPPPPPVAVAPPPPEPEPEPEPVEATPVDGPKGIVVLSARGRSRRYATNAISDFADKNDAYEEIRIESARAEAKRIDADLGSAKGRVALARALQITAYLDVEARYQRRRQRATLKVIDGRTGEAIDTVALISRSKRGIQRAVERALERLLPQTDVPAAEVAAPVVVAPPPAPPAAPPSTVASTPAALGASSEASTTARTEVPEGPREPATMSTSPIVARLDFRLFSRSLSYNDDIFGELRPYEVIGAPAIGGQVTWFIPALFTNDWYQHFALDLSGQYALGLSSQNAAGAVFDTSAVTIDAGGYARLPLGPHEIGALVGVGVDTFSIQDADGVSAEVPGVTYVTARFGGRVRFFVTDEISIRAEGAYRLVLGAGEIRDDVWFPRASVGSADAQLGVSYDLGYGFYADAGFAMRRFFYSFNPEPGDPWIAGGAADQYFAGNVSIGWYLR